MNHEAKPDRLSKIVTDWDGLRAAHQDRIGNDEVADARNRILMRYSSCIRKYILAATRNQDVAEDLAQEFALRFVRGDYRNADPAKGRFRDYLKTSVRNLITDHFRKKSPDELTVTAAERIEYTDGIQQFEGLEAEFQQNWRKQLLAHVWNELKEFESKRDNSYFTVLHHRAENPKSSSTEMAVTLSAIIGETVTAEWVRQKIHRARQKFAELLIGEVRQSMSTTDEDEIMQELAELGMQKYL
ncbi:MAG: sigma-70 family RNA polymerase sigma factor [Mariniblastus sp.]